MMKHLLSGEVHTTLGLAVAVIMGVAVTVACWKASTLTGLSLAQTLRVGGRSISALSSENLGVLLTFPAMPEVRLASGGALPDLGGAIAWLNSAPLSAKSLRGKVVLVDIWTYSCINSLRQLPYMKAWAAKYKDQGLVVVGVHSPEFGFERVRTNVETAVRDLNVAYPIAIDSNHAIWEAFNNEYWPADYFVDGKGRIRHHHFGEGDYEESERVIRELLRENGVTGLDADPVALSGVGIEAAPSSDVQSPETYVGYGRTERFASCERLSRDSRKTYTPPATLSLNQWGLGGSWHVGSESDVLQDAPGKIVFRFHSRDLHMVLGPAKDGTPVRFKVRLDGAAPGGDCGTDTSPHGTGEIREPRLYQLIRQKGKVKDRTFEIEFFEVGSQAFSFTFG